MRGLIRQRRMFHHRSVAGLPRPLLMASVTHLEATVQSQREIRRHFSDRLIGYSPMAPSIPAPSPTTEDGEAVKTKMPTAAEVSSSGGVWAPTSAKRDKLAELRIAMTPDQESLDDAATPEQRLDLNLADGILLISKTTDSISDVDTPEIQEISEWLVEQQAKLPEQMDELELSAHLAVVSERISTILSKFPASECLKDTRDFFDPSEALEEELPKIPVTDLRLQDEAFDKAVLRSRLLLTQAAVEYLKESWTLLTTVSDRDVDRAAVKGEAIEPQVKTIFLAKVYKYLFAHTSGKCSERVDAAWELIDHDEDGLLDESEMTSVANLCLAPVESALATMFEEALDAYPIRAPMPEIGSEEEVPEPPKGWRQSRKEAKIKKNLLKLFKKACKNHFENEVEINHRLRCSYAWADKAHQDNKLDSVVVDAGWTGRKRYVELSPKIALPEFRVVQQEHFTHLDRIGTEILRSFREDLWVDQGKGRQNRELMRDCLGFLTTVCIVDYLILAF
jgi:hypothetical protein